MQMCHSKCQSLLASAAMDGHPSWVGLPKNLHFTVLLDAGPGMFAASCSASLIFSMLSRLSCAPLSGR
jgi:hypothetical protein